MRLKILFALVVLSGCNSIRKFPDVDLCSAVKNGSLSQSYAYCVSYDPNSNREYRKPAEAVFKERYIMISADHFGQVKKHVEYLKKQAEKRCK